jgi:hypothetical protein
VQCALQINAAVTTNERVAVKTFTGSLLARRYTANVLHSPDEI